MTLLKLIVGLGNPSPEYDHTRHNIGALWVRRLARDWQIDLRNEAKFKGEVGRGIIAGVDVRLLLPDTYMNLSGDAVGALKQFYKFDPDQILVAYDEMAFDPGIVRLKFGGGDNGHNGIKSVRAGLANVREFHRLRIGVGHPGNKNKVTGYLTQKKMPAKERELVDSATAFNTATLALMLKGEWQEAMNVIHASDESPKGKAKAARETKAQKEQAPSNDEQPAKAKPPSGES